jgi:hypothetical protein
MLQPTTSVLRAATDLHESSRAYFLSDVFLQIPDSETAVFRARLNGPPGAKVWVRAWLSTELDGTLAEAEAGPFNTGDSTTLTVKLHDSRIPENAIIRIESAPLATEDVVVLKLPR